MNPCGVGLVKLRIPEITVKTRMVSPQATVLFLARYIHIVRTADLALPSWKEEESLMIDDCEIDVPNLD